MWCSVADTSVKLDSRIWDRASTRPSQFLSVEQKVICFPSWRQRRMMEFRPIWAVVTSLEGSTTTTNSTSWKKASLASWRARSWTLERLMMPTSSAWGASESTPMFHIPGMLEMEARPSWHQAMMSSSTEWRPKIMSTFLRRSMTRFMG